MLFITKQYIYNNDLTSSINSIIHCGKTTMKQELANKIRQAMNGGKGYDHLSPSSLSIPLAKFFINYLMFTQEERRQQLASYKANYGNACNNPVQKFLCKYIFIDGKKVKLKK